MHFPHHMFPRILCARQISTVVNRWRKVNVHCILNIHLSRRFHLQFNSFTFLAIRSSLRESITQYLYGVSKKDHINYAYISSIDGGANIDASAIEANELEVNHLSTEQRRVLLPSFNEMCNHVYEMAQKRAINSSIQKYTYGRATIVYSYEVYTEVCAHFAQHAYFSLKVSVLFIPVAQILDYLRLCLWYSAGNRFNPNEPKHTLKLNDYIRHNYVPTENNEIQRYLHLVKQILLAKRGDVELTCLNDLLNAELESLIKQCFDLLASFSLALKDVSEGTRVLVAEMVGILWAIGTPISEFNTHVSFNMPTSWAI